MKRLLLCVTWLFFIIVLVQPAFATRTPLGDVYPQIAGDGDRFIIFWFNTVTKKEYVAYYYLQTQELTQAKEATNTPNLNPWEDTTDYRFSYLALYFNTDCMVSINNIGDRTVVTGIERDSFFNLKLAIFDKEKKLIAAQSISSCGRTEFRPIASNTEFDHERCFIVWRTVSQENETHSNSLILSRWDLKNGLLEHRVVQKGNIAGNLSLYTALIGDRIGLVFIQPNEAIHRFQVVFKLFDTIHLKEMQSITIPYTGPVDVVED